MITKLCRDASSIIIASKSNILNNVKSVVNLKRVNECLNELPTEIIDKNAFNYEILMLRRSRKNRFFSGNYVFPGGAVDTSDTDKEWMKLYDYFGFSTKDFGYIFESDIKCNVPVFRNNFNSMVPKSLSMRITAIRETFEESGILLCKHKQVIKNHTPNEWSSYLAGNHIQKWQDEVKKDPLNFITLCKHLQCFPDVWALHLWSNWHTPNNINKKFDTAFFIAMVDQLPPVFVDNSEMDANKWCTPHNFIEESKCGKILLPPPQFYELSRIKSFKTLEHLTRFAVQKQRFECEQWMPVQIQTSDGVLTLLPGDDMYPIKVDVLHTEPMKTLSETFAELRNSCTKLNRMEHNGNVVTVVSNIDPS